MREAARRRDRALLFVMAGLLIGSLMIGPAGAHLGSFGHLKQHFITEKAARKLAPRSAVMTGGGLILTATPTRLGQDLKIAAPRSGWVVWPPPSRSGTRPPAPALGHCTASDCNVASQISHVQSGTSSALAAATVSGAGTTVTTHVTTSNHHRFRVGRASTPSGSSCTGSAPRAAISPLGPGS